MEILADFGGNFLLFILVFGMSATVDIANMKKQIKNKNAILTGIFLQFMILPFLGFATVKAVGMNSSMGITLLVVTSSPGGSYSNWWCSMFNADLALSVTMTAISTFMSVVMLPLNLFIYAKSSYNADIVSKIDWSSLFIALVVVISAILVGLCCSATMHSAQFSLYSNKLGNLAGVALVFFSIFVSSSGQQTQLWEHGWQFYAGVANPCILGLFFANLISTSIKLQKPECVTVSVECCYQNVGIATSIAITMFEGEELAEAIAVPLYYGLIEALILGTYCIVSWKMGWTKAPPKEKFFVMISSSYEITNGEMYINAIEVVLGDEMTKDNLDNTSSSYLGSDSECYIYGVFYPNGEKIEYGSEVLKKKGIKYKDDIFSGNNTPKSFTQFKTVFPIPYSPKGFHDVEQIDIENQLDLKNLHRIRHHHKERQTEVIQNNSFNEAHKINKALGSSEIGKKSNITSAKFRDKSSQEEAIIVSDVIKHVSIQTYDDASKCDITLSMSDSFEEEDKKIKNI